MNFIFTETDSVDDENVSYDDENDSEDDVEGWNKLIIDRLNALINILAYM